jgi:hypothetical protein
MDKKSQVDQAERSAIDAKQLLENPMLRAAFVVLENEYLAAWRGSDHGDAAKRETAFFRLRALDEMKRDLSAVVSGGKVASFNQRRSLIERLTN